MTQADRHYYFITQKAHLKAESKRERERFSRVAEAGGFGMRVAQLLKHMHA